MAETNNSFKEKMKTKPLTSSLTVYLLFTILGIFVFHNAFTAVGSGFFAALLSYKLLTKTRNFQNPSAKPVYTAKIISGRKGKLVNYPMGKPICQTCYKPYTEFNPNGTHNCDIHADKIKNPDSYNNILEYNAIFKDWMGNVKWNCGHNHTSGSAADLCASEHYNQHVNGSCKCVYFPQTSTPPSYKAAQSHVYLMKNKNLDAVKVGISRSKVGTRIGEHQINGWELVAYYPEITWEKAYKTEQAVIEKWRMNNIGFGAMFSEMPQKGASETAPLRSVNLQKLVDEISELTGTTPQSSMRGNK